MDLFRRSSPGIRPCADPLVDLHGRSSRRYSLWYCSFCIRRWHHLWCPGQPGHWLWDCSQLQTCCIDGAKREKLLSVTKSVMAFFSRDPREVNGKVVPRIFLQQLRYRLNPPQGSSAWLQTVSFPLGRTHWRSRRKWPASRLNVLRCTACRSWSWHPTSLRAFYCTYTQSTALYCASSWM